VTTVVKVEPAASVTRTTTGSGPPSPGCSSSTWPDLPSQVTLHCEVVAHVQLAFPAVNDPEALALDTWMTMSPGTLDRTRREKRLSLLALRRRASTVGTAPLVRGGAAETIGAGADGRGATVATAT